MSCRYWSNAPEGLVRKNAFALPFDRAIARAPPWTLDKVVTEVCERQYRNSPAAVQIFGFFHITNPVAVAWVRHLSTIHIACGEIDVDRSLIAGGSRCGEVHTCVGSC